MIARRSTHVYGYVFNRHGARVFLGRSDEYMSILVLGPTCSGKSSYIVKRRISPVTFGWQIGNGTVPEIGAIHFNILHGSGVMRGMGDDYGKRVDAADSTLARLLRSGKIEEAVILVSPVRELLARATRRRFVEPQFGNSEDIYLPGHWRPAIAKADFPTIYNDLLNSLQLAGIRFEMIYSSAKYTEFMPTDRNQLRANLRGRYVHPFAPRSRLRHMLDQHRESFTSVWREARENWRSLQRSAKLRPAATRVTQRSSSELPDTPPRYR